MTWASWLSIENITTPLNQFVSETVPATVEEILAVVVMGIILFGFFFIVRQFVRW